MGREEPPSPAGWGGLGGGHRGMGWGAHGGVVGARAPQQVAMQKAQREPTRKANGHKNVVRALRPLVSGPTAQDFLGFAVARQASRQTARDFLGFVRPISVKTRCEL